MSKWEKVKIKDVCTIVSGGTPKTSVEEYWNSEDVVWITPTDITKLNSKYISNSSRKISEKGLAESSATLLPIGSVLMCSRATIGPCAVNTIPVSTNQGFKSFVCGERINNEYLYYLISILKDYFIDNASGSTFLEVSKSVVENCELMLPPLKEQQKIASILSSVDAAIEKTEQVIAKTEEVKKGLMQQLLTKGIGHTKFKQTEIGEIPVDWEVKKLNEVATFSQGLQVPVENQYTESNNSNIRFLRIVDYTQLSTEARYIDLVDNKYIINPDEVVMVRYGATAGFVGRGMTGVIANNLFKISPEGILLKDYLYLFLKQDKIFNMLNNSTGASAMPAVNFSQVGSLKMAIPPLSEQQEIYATLNKLEEGLLINHTKLQKLLNVKKGLMQQLLTGQVRVRID